MIVKLARISASVDWPQRFIRTCSTESCEGLWWASCTFSSLRCRLPPPCHRCFLMLMERVCWNCQCDFGWHWRFAGFLNMPNTEGLWQNSWALFFIGWGLREHPLQIEKQNPSKIVTTVLSSKGRYIDYWQAYLIEETKCFAPNIWGFNMVQPNNHGNIWKSVFGRAQSVSSSPWGTESSKAEADACGCHRWRFTWLIVQAQFWKYPLVI